MLCAPCFARQKPWPLSTRQDARPALRALPCFARPALRAVTAAFRALPCFARQKPWHLSTRKGARPALRALARFARPALCAVTAALRAVAAANSIWRACKMDGWTTLFTEDLRGCTTPP